MLNCYCVKCGSKIEAVLFSPSKLLVTCSNCKSTQLISLSSEELCVKVKKSAKKAKEMSS
jgi:hypothetical protein